MSIKFEHMTSKLLVNVLTNQTTAHRLIRLFSRHFQVELLYIMSSAKTWLKTPITVALICWCNMSYQFYTEFDR